uniref:Phosphatidic acid phosphatase type 2/haloperoxidase domain-containing protein n=1 Tax=Ascaris suum TaxID=6253 RepID=F1L4A1_ASCSU
MVKVKPVARAKTPEKSDEENSSVKKDSKRTSGKEDRRSMKESEKHEKREEKSGEDEKQSNKREKKSEPEERSPTSPKNLEVQQTKKSSAPEGGDKMPTNATISVPIPSGAMPNEQPELHTQGVALGPFICDILICITLAFIFTVIPTYFIEPYHRGFYCNDQDIRYPYKESTITTTALYFISFGILFLTIVGTEFFRIIQFSKSSTTSKIAENINIFIIRFLTYFAHGIFGLLLNLAFTQTTKWIVGRLRPHFYNICNISNARIICREPNKYLTNYVCKGPEELVKEARLSFFSGHSAFSMGTAVFCVIYMQARLPRRMYGITLLPVLQALLIGVALVVGLSRLGDNMHFWSDVLVGFLVGCGTGYYSAVILARVFERADLNFNKEERQPMTESSGQHTVDINGDNTATTRTTCIYPTLKPASSTIPPTQITATSVGLPTTISEQPSTQHSTVLITTEALKPKH